MTERQMRLKRIRTVSLVVLACGAATILGLILTDSRQPWLVWPVFAITAIAGITASTIRVLLWLRD